MSGNVELVRNAAGRMIPTMVNGLAQVPFQEVGKYKPTGRRSFHSTEPKYASSATYHLRQNAERSFIAAGIQAATTVVEPHLPSASI